MAQVIKAPLFAGDKNPKQANAIDNIKKFFNFYILNILNIYIHIYLKTYQVLQVSYRTPELQIQVKLRVTFLYEEV